MSSREERRIPDDHIAVAAYYRAERRNFSEGGELDDWLEAERALTEPDGQNAASAVHNANGSAERDFRSVPEDFAPDEVRHFAEENGVTAEEVRTAIQRVGPNRAQILQALGDHAASSDNNSRAGRGE